MKVQEYKIIMEIVPKLIRIGTPKAFLHQFWTITQHVSRINLQCNKRSHKWPSSKSWCGLVALLALIDNARQFSHAIFKWWDVGIALLPCFNSQAPALHDLNSTARCAAVITGSIFVLLCTTYYQTLLLSSRYVRSYSIPYGIRYLRFWRTSAYTGRTGWKIDPRRGGGG